MNGCRITYHQNQKWLTKCLSLSKTNLKMYENRDTLFQPTHFKSALNNLPIQYQMYQIKGLNEYDPESFLLNSKQSITSLMINTRQTKVKLILSCMIEKVDLKSGEVIAKEAAFHSEREVNLESTNFNELLSKMKETVLESLAKFESKGSNSIIENFVKF